jgi:ABC-type transport system involved in multi-copper enzyme maturation permease subunit
MAQAEKTNSVLSHEHRRRALLKPFAIELFTGLLLFLAALGFYKSYLRGESLSQVAWGALGLVSLAILSRRGWLQLCGPVLFYDLVRLARRNRYFLIRVLYIGTIILLLLWQYNDTFISQRMPWGWPGGRMRFAGSGSASAAEGAVFAEQFFNKFMVFQFALVMLLTPVYTAGAIAEEKDRRTLEFLLSTDLANREIILSKFLSRFANLAIIVITGIPVLSAIQFLGGVDPDLLLASFVALVLTMASLASLSIFYSVYSRKPRDAILLTYFVVAAYVSLGILGQIAISSPAVATTAFFGSGLTCQDVVDGYNSGNLPVVLYKLQQAVNVPVRAMVFAPGGMRVIKFVAPTAAATLASVVPAFLRNFAIFHGLLILVTIGWAISRVRLVALGQTSRESRRRLRVKRIRQRPAIGRLPMIWKELFVEPGFRLTRMGRIVVWLLVVLSFIPAIWIVWNCLETILVYGSTKWWGTTRLSVWAQIGNELNPWLRIAGTAVATLLLIGVAVRASTCIGGERDRETLDALLATPLQSNDILLAKWLGSLLSVRWGWLWLMAIWGVGLATGAIHPAMVVLSMLAWLVYASFLSGLGIWYSTACRTTLRATMKTLSLTAFFFMGPWALWMFCMPFGPGGGNFLSGNIWSSSWWYTSFGFLYELSAFLGLLLSSLSPPTVLYQISATSSVVHNDANWDMMALQGYLGLAVWMIASVILWSFTRRRFRRMTARMPYRRPAPPAAEMRWREFRRRPSIALPAGRD